MSAREGFTGRHRAEASVGDEFGDSLGAVRARLDWTMAPNRQTFRPPFDVYETGEHVVIKAEIAGMREEGFSISLDGRMLRISGVRGDSGGKLAYQRMEINYGEFRLDVRLPHIVEQSEIEASYDRGFLSVYIPRQPRQRRVPVLGSDAG